MSGCLPILFNQWSVEAILAGRKTQTRRLVKPQPDPGEPFIGPEWYEPAIANAQPGKTVYGIYHPDGDWGIKCPYVPNDEPWVKETAKLFSISGVGDKEEWTIKYRAQSYPKDHTVLKTVPKQKKKWGHFNKWSPSLFMPRWASRITVRITNIRAEWLNDISAADILAEGIQPGGTSLRTQWETLWNSINAKRGYEWETNPLVWAYTIEVIKK